MAENPPTARRICVLSILLLICTGRVTTAGGSAIPIPQESVMTTSFHISPQGDDAWSGQLAEPNAERSDGPFRTIDRAQTAARKLIEFLALWLGAPIMQETLQPTA